MFILLNAGSLSSDERRIKSDRHLLRTLFDRLAELAEYVDGDAIYETVDRCPSKVQ